MSTSTFGTWTTPFGTFPWNGQPSTPWNTFGQTGFTPWFNQFNGFQNGTPFNQFGGFQNGCTPFNTPFNGWNTPFNAPFNWTAPFNGTFGPSPVSSWSAPVNGWNAPGFHAPFAPFGTPSFFGTPVNTPFSFGTPSFGTPSFGTPSFGTPNFSTPFGGTPFTTPFQFNSPFFGNVPPYAWQHVGWPQYTQNTQGQQGPNIGINREAA